MKQAIYNICQLILGIVFIGALLFSCQSTGDRIERMMNPCKTPVTTYEKGN